MAAPKAPAVELDVAGRTVRVTSPDRVVFPERGLTKLDVVQHFVTMGDGILGALLHRPTTLERWPKGVFEGARMATRADSTGDAFYQKRVPQGPPEVLGQPSMSISRRISRTCGATRAASEKSVPGCGSRSIRSWSGESTSSLVTGQGWNVMVPMLAAQATTASSVGHTGVDRGLSL